jgi:hypothetical protein
MATAALQSQINRLDALLDQRLKREEAEQARADASLEEARRAKMHQAAEQRREIAARYDSAYQSFGTTVPEAVDDESPMAYRRRLFNRLARKLSPDHDLAQIRADDLGSQPIVFDNFETELIKAAIAEGQRPSASNLPDDGSMVMRTRTDANTGTKFNEFYGTESFIRGFTRPGRRVAAIIDRNTGQAIWGRPLPTAR